MKKALSLLLATLPIALLASAGCENPSAPEGETCSQCPGASPAYVIGDLVLTKNYSDCLGAPLSGQMLPLATGGWLFTAYGSPCCTDTSVYREFRVKPDGNIEGRDLESSLFFENPYYAWPVATLSNGIVYSLTAPRDNPDTGSAGPYRFSIHEDSYDGTVLWTLTTEMLGNPDSGGLLATPRGDETWWLLHYGEGAAAGTARVIRVDADGTVGYSGTVPAEDGQEVRILAAADGIVFVLSGYSVDGATGSLTVRLVHLDWDGTVGSPVTIGQWDHPSENGIIGFSAAPVPDNSGRAVGILMGITQAATSGGDSSLAETLFVKNDGTVTWRHPGSWNNPSLLIDLKKYRYYDDGRIGAVGHQTDWLNNTEPNASVIAADGSRDYPANLSLDGQAGNVISWQIFDWRVTGEGNLIIVDADRLKPGAGAETTPAVIVAMYDLEFSKLKWVRVCDEFSDPVLIQDFEGWTLALRKDVPADECTRDLSSTTLLHFDSLDDI